MLLIVASKDCCQVRKVDYISHVARYLSEQMDIAIISYLMTVFVIKIGV